MSNLREQAGISVIDLAKMYSVTRQTVYNWEKSEYPNDVLCELQVLCLTESGNETRIALIRDIKQHEEFKGQLQQSARKVNDELQRLLNELHKGDAK